jgi:lactate dehydrogenase-like 2-hydroxyacid dehydrogenase
MGKPRVFVVQPIPEPALNAMREVAEVEVYPYTDRMVSVDELIEAALRSDYIYTMHETTVPESVILANPNLKGIVGTEHSLTIDVEACKRHGVPIISRPFQRPPYSTGGPMPDLNMAMILNLAYKVLEADRYSRTVGFRQEQTMDLMGVGVPGKTVGLIGFGRIGRGMVPSLHAFEMPIIYTKRTRLPLEEEQELGIEWCVDKDDILRRADFVLMLVDYNPSTHKLIGEREFKLMKPTAFFINTGRGRLVDEPALIRALQDGTIAGAGLDVFWDEPPVTHGTHVPREFYKMDNVVLTPHNGGATWDSRTRGTLNSALALVDFVKATASAPAALAGAVAEGVHR